MANIKLDFDYTGIDKKLITRYAKKVEEIHNKLNE